MRCSLFVGRCASCVFLMFVSCWLLCVAGCPLFVVCCVLCGGVWSLLGVRCSLFGVCCLLFAAW